MKSLILWICMMLAATPAAASTSWITAGDTAYLKIRKIQPGAKVLGSSVPGMAGTEKLHLIEVKTSSLDKLGARLHQELRHCGGFMYHASEADGRRALAMRDAIPLTSLTRPAYTITNQATVVPMLQQMDEARIRDTITGLAGFANRYYLSAPGIAASGWLKARWMALANGRDHISIAQYAHLRFDQRSVIATIDGSDKPNEVIIIGAHLDSINLLGTKDTTKAPGADDDASGVAGLTEVLRVIAATGYKPRRTIKLIAYAAEEVGLRGSQEIAQEYKKTGTNVVGVLQLDMTNFKGSANDIYIFSDFTDAPQNQFLVKLVNAYLPTLTVGYDKCGYACSDHAAWHAQGYAASMPFESEIKKDNPRIHTAGDTLANSGGEAAHALKFARLAAAYAVELGSEVATVGRTTLKPGAAARR
ncbi:M20/M25/M40 family metallo-hydrolase [Massilia sp. GCM10020059]|uniref:M20/M25/M40 family metallo-hydrolase n=1 Tax=Massilia agrisoli TaxID=2892444 RepID=A0ABS8IYK7_9BURK|nr:M20/M25/M40 family metallo-hydrolase [Massilia agrisoli]MCC6072993.1 M20/M25/M40 family metallo-hydrolase [Massilia agrisoli]